MSAPVLPPSAEALYDTLMSAVEPRLTRAAVAARPESEPLGLSPDEVASAFAKWADSLDQYTVNHGQSLHTFERQTRQSLEQQQSVVDLLAAEEVFRSLL